MTIESSSGVQGPLIMAVGGEWEEGLGWERWGLGVGDLVEWVGVLCVGFDEGRFWGRWCSGMSAVCVCLPALLACVSDIY